VKPSGIRSVTVFVAGSKPITARFVLSNRYPCVAGTAAARTPPANH
jgi:hypothetical protein